jgi:Protein of unknown function (DUF2865)
MSRVPRAFAVATIVLALAFAAFGLWLISSASTPRLTRVVSTDASAHSIIVSRMIVTASWIDTVFGDLHSTSQLPPPQSDSPTAAPPTAEKRRARIARPTFRSLCVRLCDGYYFPISQATIRERFSRDAEQCAQTCPSGSRLFVHRNPGEGVDDMRDLQGRPYRGLPNAFLHRTQYVANCTCRGNPWDETALARHQAYADAARLKTASKTADKPASIQTERSTRARDRSARTSSPPQ